MIIQSVPLRLGVLLIGWISLALGFIGIFLPILPTTPFILLAAYCFSKSSPQLHHCLLHQPTLGPMIQNWEQHGSISKRAKVTATVTMLLLFSFSLFILSVGILLKTMLIGIAAGVLAFIWTRPLPPYDRSRETQTKLANEM
ncbi:MAG: hypothetical protein NPIRA05_12780 [Nitrospirales bacterium]|nr:MAG: hypothetical protein NPIRA05_12780 [Nitrospirales bacterium]